MKPEEQRVVWKHGEQGEEVTLEEAAAESGSRVFSLPSPPVERMLTFRRRSSTRVFVRKKPITDKEPGKGSNFTRELRSGKRIYLPEPAEKSEDHYSGEWDDIRWLEKNGKEESILGGSFVPESDGNEMAALGTQGQGKMFVNVYSRKRQKNSSLGGLDSASTHDVGQDNGSRYRVVFSRKPKKKKPEVTNDFGKVSGYQFGETEDFFRAGARHDFLQFRESKNNLLEPIGNNESELRTSFSDPLVLVLLSKPSCNDCSVKFGRFLISVISWMRRARMNICNLAAFLLSEPMSNAFLQHGIHFLPVTDRNKKFLLRNCKSNFGTCKIYSPCEFLPLISLNFLALPSYFKSLHLSALLDSLYFDFTLSSYFNASDKKLNPDAQCNDCDSHVHLETDFPGAVLSSSVRATVNNKATNAAQSSAVVARSAGVFRGTRLRKLQRKRSLKVSNARKFFSMNCHGTSCASQNGANKHSVDPLNAKQLENFDDDPLLNFHNNKISSTSPVSQSKLIEVAKNNHGWQMKEIKAALSDIKQNIDSVQCNANILVTVGDRCWREEGAVVLLELSSSREWCLVVKIRSDFRYLHCPQDMKYTLNRFTHAHMWIAEDGWRLEFSEKLDWLIFKELHAECCQRNNHHEDASVKFIPVPVFKDVPTYEDDRASSFVRPEQYILMKHDDEILRATVSETPYYDIDSGDEEWLQKHNSSCSTTENDTSYISEDTFERMIFTFEKNSFYNSSNVTPLEGEPSNHEELGSKYMVADVYDYWLKKRKQRRGPLVRVFQGLSQRKPQLMQRPVLRKRRPLKRQRSQVGRGKPACWFNSKAKEEAKTEALLKVQEAENTWRESMEAAIPLRRRAQLLMENADLAVYKSVMALRIAESIRSMPADESALSFHDWLPEELPLS